MTTVLTSEACCGFIRVSVCWRHAWLVASAVGELAAIIATILRRHGVGHGDDKSEVLNGIGWSHVLSLVVHTLIMLYLLSYCWVLLLHFGKRAQSFLRFFAQVT